MRHRNNKKGKVKYMYWYYIEYYDEKESHECGVTAGDSYSEAVDNLVDYYGEENVIMLKITDLCSTVVAEDEIRDLKKDED